MTKVQGPLFSMEAKGTLKNTLTFQKRKGSFAVYKRSKPGDRGSNNISTGQSSMRFMYFVTQMYWKMLDYSTKDQFNELAKQQDRPMNGFNYVYKLAVESRLTSLGFTDWWMFNELDGFFTRNMVEGRGDLTNFNPLGELYSSLVNVDNPRIPVLTSLDAAGAGVYYAGGETIDYNIHTGNLGVVEYIRLVGQPDSYLLLYTKTQMVDGYGLAIAPGGYIACYLSDGVTAKYVQSTEFVPLNKLICITFSIQRNATMWVAIDGKLFCEIDISALDGIDISNTDTLNVGFLPPGGLNPQVHMGPVLVMSDNFSLENAKAFTRFIHPNFAIA